MSLVEFDEWKEEFGVNDSKYSIEHYLMEQAFKAGQQSRQGEVYQLQTEIDEITKQRDSFIKAHHISMNDVCEHKDKIDELQGRIDGAMKILLAMKHNGAYKAIDILTGVGQ